MNEQTSRVAELIESGAAVLGIEFGSTRIKAALIAPDTTPLASGSYAWENQLRDGVWTYDMTDVWKGLAACYASLVEDVRARYGTHLRTVASLGISGMMHGYVALDADGNLLVPFRTWRNNITGAACAELTPLLDFAVPQRWSIAHLHQSILDGQPHLSQLAHLKTLAAYVHWRLTGEHVVGLDEASGMFPIDPVTRDWDAARMATFDALIAPRNLGWTLRDILPTVLPAGIPAGTLTAEGARLLDPSGTLAAGIPLCPPEGDAGTGMVATNAVRPRSGNVSAGTSIFAMIVLEQSLSRVHEEIDIVVTPDGSPVAMAHSNNGTSDLDAWVSLFGQVGKALGASVTPDELYGRLLPLAVAAEPDAGGLLAINYVSGEHMTGFTEGRPLFARNEDARLTLENFMRAQYFASLCSLRTGLDILTEQEGVVIEEIRGHGGFFKGGDTGQRMMAAALNVPVGIPATAGEGGAWGMAVLAAYMLRADAAQSLPDYLDGMIAGEHGDGRRARPRGRGRVRGVLRPPPQGTGDRARGDRSRSADQDTGAPPADRDSARGAQGLASGAQGLGQPDLHHQVAGQALQVPADGGHVDVFGDGDVDPGVEHEVAGVGRRRPVGGELLDVDPVRREQGRDLVDQAGTVQPQEVDLHRVLPGRVDRRAPLDDDLQAAGLEPAQCLLQRRRALLGDLDAQHARELAREVRHPALEPVAAVGVDDLRHRADDAGVVRADEREDEVDHGRIVARSLVVLQTTKPEAGQPCDPIQLQGRTSGTGSRCEQETCSGFDLPALAPDPPFLTCPTLSRV